MTAGEMTRLLTQGVTPCPALCWVPEIQTWGQTGSGERRLLLTGGWKRRASRSFDPSFLSFPETMEKGLLGLGRSGGLL